MLHVRRVFDSDGALQQVALVHDGRQGVRLHALDGVSTESIDGGFYVWFLRSGWRLSVRGSRVRWSACWKAYVDRERGALERIDRDRIGYWKRTVVPESRERNANKILWFAGS